MAKIEGVEESEGQQRSDARKVLRLIEREGYDGHLTYSRVAEMLGKRPPSSYGRAMAAVGDLLDAAACVEGVPALALVAIRNQDREVNPRAWHEFGSKRQAIIDRSLRHSFSPEDFKKIRRGLEALAPRGRTAAWEFLRTLYPGDLLYRRVVGDYSDPLLDAIDDIGSDEPLRVRVSGYTYLRDERVRARVLERAGGRCEFCGAEGFLKEDGTRYLESHHVIALAQDGEDRETNVIALCANDHRQAHFGANRELIEREMQERLREVCG